MEIRKLEGIIEAILFTMGGSVELGRLAGALEEPQERIREAIAAMQERYRAEDRGINIVELEGAYQMCTKPEAYDYLIRIAKQPKKSRCLLMFCWRLCPSSRISSRLQRLRSKRSGEESDHAVNKLVEYNLACEVEDWMRRGDRFIWNDRRVFTKIQCPEVGGSSGNRPGTDGIL